MSTISIKQLKTAIAISSAPWIGTYQGTQSLFTSVNQIFDVETYSPYLWRFNPTPLIFDSTLTTLPSIWVKGSDPPAATVVGGIEIVLSRVIRGLRDTRNPEYYECTLINYSQQITMDLAIDSIVNSWHPYVCVSQNPTYIPRSGINNERCIIRLVKGVKVS